MVFVELRLNSLDLLSYMADMRVWLDGHCIETAGFSYREHIDRATARVAFKMRAQAEAFAARFSGRIVHSTSMGYRNRFAAGRGAASIV
jgi:hypothetical protein